MPNEKNETLKENTPAADSLVTHGVDTSRSSVLAIIMGQLGGKSLDDLNGFAASLVPPAPVNADAAHNAATIQAKPSFAAAVQEDVEELLKDQQLTEEFKEKAKTLFEAAVSMRVSLEEARIQEEYTTKLTEAEEKLTEEVVEKVDSYLDYVVEEWMKENQVAVDQQIRSDIAVSFMDKLKGLFEDHYIELPEEKVDVANELADHVVELEDKLDTMMKENIELKKRDEEVDKTKVLQKLSEGLTLVDSEKLTTLCEGIESANLEDFSKKAQVVKEHFLTKKTGDAPAGGDKKLLTEETEVEGDVVVVQVQDESVISESVIEDPQIAKYVSAISRTNPKKTV